MSSIVPQPQSSLSLYSAKVKNMNFLNSRIYPSLYRYLPNTPSTQSLSMFFVMGFFEFSHSPSSFRESCTTTFCFLSPSSLLFRFSLSFNKNSVLNGVLLFLQVLIFQFEQVNKNKGFFGFFGFSFLFLLIGMGYGFLGYKF
ncbi:hypothetical protein ES319_D06G119400v1 [Gossypium barbadense]|uniref:Transmembrane protein n=1 Tax=Gossypium barbadense TaxID=3634 RepID=A0A5J5R3Q7_GOSBA|nr:hypothetical protein ES319_D06G119400v1 [Gossypium barbadense]